MTALLSLFPGPYNGPRRAPGTLYPLSPPVFDATVFDVRVSMFGSSGAGAGGLRFSVVSHKNRSASCQSQWTKQARTNSSVYRFRTTRRDTTLSRDFSDSEQRNSLRLTRFVGKNPIVNRLFRFPVFGILLLQPLKYSLY